MGFGYGWRRRLNIYKRIIYGTSSEEEIFKYITIPARIVVGIITIISGTVLTTQLIQIDRVTAAAQTQATETAVVRSATEAWRTAVALIPTPILIERPIGQIDPPTVQHVAERYTPPSSLLIWSRLSLNQIRPTLGISLEGRTEDLPIVFTSTSVRPRLSPDGSQIAYVDILSGQDVSQLFIYTFVDEESQSTQFTTRVTDFAWSPDGEKLAIFRSVSGTSYQVEVLEARTLRVTRQVYVADNITAVDWLDDDWLVVSENSESNMNSAADNQISLTYVKINGSDTTKVPIARGLGFVGAARTSPSKDYFALVLRDGGVIKLAVLDFNANPISIYLIELPFNRSTRLTWFEPSVLGGYDEAGQALAFNVSNGQFYSGVNGLPTDINGLDAWDGQ